MVNGCRGVAAASASARAALQFNSSNVAFSPHFRRISSLMAAKAEKTEFIDNTARRKWDKEEYERRAKERAERDEAAVVEVKNFSQSHVERAPLVERDYRVDVEDRVGKCVVITSATPKNEQGGFYCEVCDCTLKDSVAWLDHINGKKHNRALGYSMKVERASVSAVQRTLSEYVPKKLQAPAGAGDAVEELDARIARLREEEERQKEEKRAAKKAKKAGDDGDEGGDSALALMDLPMSFGKKKK